MATSASLNELAGDKADKHASAIMKRLLRKDKSQPVAVILRGTFRVAQKGKCLGARYEIEVTDPLSAQPASPSTQEGYTPDPTEARVHTGGHAQGTSAP